jgi:hypothetical protein
MDPTKEAGLEDIEAYAHKMLAAWPAIDRLQTPSLDRVNFVDASLRLELALASALAKCIEPSGSVKKLCDARIAAAKTDTALRPWLLAAAK